jgi:hypothetical protein
MKKKNACLPGGRQEEAGGRENDAEIQSINSYSHLVILIIAGQIESTSSPLWPRDGHRRANASPHLFDSVEISSWRFQSDKKFKI